MLAKRIIPCLDIKDGQTVKGTNFVNLRQAGDPVELGKAYSEQGADELVYLDITASHEGRKTFTELVKRIAAEINIPFTVGGGIHELADVDRLLNAGADKISINSAALKNPALIDDIARHFGSQVCVVAIDARQTPAGWKCYLNGGRLETDRYLYEWAQEANQRGAGEILFTSMDHDGVKTGYANEALAHLAQTLSIPVIASGGAGAKEHFRDAFLLGKADAALAQCSIRYVKSALVLPLYLSTWGRSSGIQPEHARATGCKAPSSRSWAAKQMAECLEIAAHAASFSSCASNTKKGSFARYAILGRSQVTCQASRMHSSSINASFCRDWR